MRRVATILTALLFTLQCFSQHYPLKNFIGTNCRADNLTAAVGDPKEVQNVVTPIKQQAIISAGIKGLRIYVDATVTKSDDNKQYRLNPDGRGFRMNDGIAMLRKSIPDLFVNIAYQNQPKNIQAEWTGIRSSIYRHLNSDPNLSTSYSEIAHDCAVLAASGGSNTNVQDYPLFTSVNWWENVGDYQQVMYKGAGFYNSIAGGNEWDNLWTNDRYVTGAQYAAAWKPIYDSVKRNDPNMIVSSTGVMTQEPQILLDAIAWCNTHNGGKLPFDEYEFHCYPWGWEKNIASALPPEMNIIPACKKILAAAPNVSFVVGEWSPGDRALNSNMGIRPFNGHTAEEIQGWWGARGIFGMAATGMKRSFFYQAYQDYGHINDNNGEQFITSSLFIEEADRTVTRYPVGDVIKNISSFGNYVYQSTIVDDRAKLVYRFTNGANYLYTGWTVENVQLVTINGTNRAQFTENKSNYIFPAGTQYDVVTGQSKPFYGGTIELSSKPVIIVTNIILPIDTTTYTRPIPHKKYNVKVYRLRDGYKILDKKDVDIEEVKKTLPRKQNLVILYNDNKNFYTEKLYKL